MDRRNFVKQLAGGTALSLIASQGLQAKMAYNPLLSCESNWQLATKAMQTNKKAALVISVPNSIAIKTNLMKVFIEDNKTLQELMARYIPVCLNEYYFKQTLKTSDKNLALVSRDQKKQDFYNVDLNGTANQIAVKIKDTVYGKDLQNIKALDKNVALQGEEREAIKSALIQLDAESYKERRKGKVYLSKNFDKAYAAIVLTQYNAISVEQSESCKEILRSKFQKDKTKIFGKSILNPTHYQRYGIKCGMASMPESSRDFINLITA